MNWPLVQSVTLPSPPHSWEAPADLCDLEGQQEVGVQFMDV